LKILIEGHTDNQGEKDKNQALSEARAMRIKTELIKKGIDASRLQTVGYGSEKPILANDSEQNRQQNRRVEFLILE
jgi:OmpA-OmpF porin, OOP family